MNELLAKISSYNIFNYLLPGTVFAAISEIWLKVPIKHDNLLVAAFLYYFIGMIISRIGSLIIEPLAKAVGFVKYANYSDFVKASQKDEKLDVLSEANNTYRTLAALFLTVVMLRIYFHIESSLAFLQPVRLHILVAFLLLLFLASYRKQSGYITKRVHANK
jgi:hypothetical protein